MIAPVTAIREEAFAPAMTDVMASKLVDEGRGVATAIDASVAAINAKRLDDAKAELDKAVAGLTKLSADLPTVDLVVELWRKNKELEIADMQTTVDTIPLLATLTRVDVPVYNRKQIEARHQQRKAQSPEAVSTGDKLGDLGLVDSNLVYLEVDMPIAATKIAVEEARRLLGEGKAEAAKDVLQGAVSSFDVIEIVAEAPEYQSRRLVWAAENALVRGDTAEAARLIGEASDKLAPLATREEDPEARAMVTTLLAEMKPLQAALISGEAEPSGSLRRIERNALSLARRTALRSMMSRHQHAEHRALADASMWLEKAETEGVTKLEHNTVATADLGRALTALANASKVAPPSAASNFADLQQRVERIIELDRAAPRDPVAIEGMLRDVIFDLRMLMLEVGMSPVASGKQPA